MCKQSSSRAAFWTLRSLMIFVPSFLSIICIGSTVLAQERWVYKYNGPENHWDEAYSIAMGPDGNLYVAGCINMGVGGTYSDFAVVSLADSGDSGVERWVYRRDGSAGFIDEALSIDVAPDGNIYAAGYSSETGTSQDFAVISLTDSGDERWVYLYDGPASSDDQATSVIVGSDGNVYAAGCSDSSETSLDITVISLTPSGTVRWVYRYSSPGSFDDQTYSLAMGSDGNIYVAGSSVGVGGFSDFAVTSLTDTGVERWVYLRGGSANGIDEAYSIATGANGKIYAAGCSWETGSWYDFAVVSMTESGDTSWVYLYNGPGNNLDEVLSVAVGSDGEIYVAGRSEGSGTNFDLTVVNLDTLGDEHWVYRYDGPAGQSDRATSIASGPDGGIYAAGFSTDTVASRDFIVVGLDTSEALRWIYRHNGDGNLDDEANSVVVGSDGNVYAAGFSVGAGTSGDFTVISLSPDVGVEEESNRPSVCDFSLGQNHPNPFRESAVIAYFLPATADVTLEIHDVTGRVVETLIDEKLPPGVHTVNWIANVPSGTYFCRLHAGDFTDMKKMILLR